MLQSLLDGVLAGTGYAVMGVAFLLVLESVGILCVGLGAVYVVGPYLAGSILAAGGPPPLAWLVAVAGGTLVALLQEELVHWPLARKRASGGVQFIGSLGVYLVLAQTVVMVWGPDPKSLQAGLPQVLHLVGLRLTVPQLLGAVAAVLVLVGLRLVASHTSIGLELRALADNPALFSLTGRDMRRARRIIFAIAGGLVVVASVSTAYDLGYDPKVGMTAVLISFAVAILAGRDSLLRIFAAGLGVGAFRALVAWLLGTEWQDAATFGLLTLLMLPLPRGLEGLSAGARRLEELR